MSLTYPSTEHVHKYDRPKAKPRTDRADGMYFLMWFCECGASYASDLKSREEIQAIAQQYRERLSTQPQQTVEPEPAPSVA